MINGKKALLVLGAISAMNEIVIDAKQMGYYVVVTDYLENSPAKRYADETWMLSIDDVDGIVAKCKERNIDGVINYCIDPGQKPYQQICEKLGVPCVAGLEQFEIMTNKGLKNTQAIILGRIKKFAELIPITSNASICSVTRIVPISEAMLLPTFPARIKHMMEEENSNKIISRVV